MSTCCEQPQPLRFQPMPCACGGSGTGETCGAPAQRLKLCDSTCTPFLRWVMHDCDGAVTQSWDTAMDGTTLYEPVGEVGDCDTCDECEPVPMCAKLTGISGPDQWVMPEGTESMTISIVCGSITITDCQGEQTVLSEGCGTLSWSAPRTTPCGPGALCSPFVVDIPDGGAVYVNYLVPCEESP